MLYQKYADINWHFIVYYSHKMVFAKQNYKIYDPELWTIIKNFKIWLHYLEKIIYRIFVLTDYNNLKKFIKKTCLGCNAVACTLAYGISIVSSSPT